MIQVQTHQMTIDEVRGDREWSALEQAVLDACKTGVPAVLDDDVDDYLDGNLTPPEVGDEQRRVRPELIRYLMLGGCDVNSGARPNPNGVQIAGGWIDGKLHLISVRSQLALLLDCCRMPSGANLTDAWFGALFLRQCRVEGALNLQRLRTDANVYLSDKFHCSEEVDLGGARIGGQLACIDATFAKSLGRALNCNAAEIGASVFLGRGFRADAEVSLIRARIGGQLDCSGGTFAAKKGLALDCNAVNIGADVFLRNGFQADAEVSFVGARIGGGLECTVEKEDPPIVNGDLFLASARISGRLLFRRVEGIRPEIDLREAKVGSLHDNWAAWDGAGRLKLDGFIYDSVEGSMTIPQRLEWLRKSTDTYASSEDNAEGPAFDPQPYVQLAKVLRQHGDRRGASEVLIEREKLQRKADRAFLAANRKSSTKAHRSWLVNGMLRPFDWLFDKVFGYGHRPARALWTTLGLILLAGLLNLAAFNAGQFAPNSAVIMTSADWINAVAASDPNGPSALQIWRDTSPAARDYETFTWWLYGIDLVLPFDTLGQEEAWRATTGEWFGGHFIGNLAFYTRWGFQIAGILLAAVGAAVLTGLVGRRD